MKGKRKTSIEKWIIFWITGISIFVFSYWYKSNHPQTHQEKSYLQRGNEKLITEDRNLNALKQRFYLVEREVSQKKNDQASEGESYEVIKSDENMEVIYLGKLNENARDLKGALLGSRKMTPETSFVKVASRTGNKSDTTTEGSLNPGGDTTPGTTGTGSATENNGEDGWIGRVGVPGQPFIPKLPDFPEIPGLPQPPGTPEEPAPAPPNPPESPAPPPVELTKVDPNRANFEKVNVRLITQGVGKVSSLVEVNEMEYVPGEILVKYKNSQDVYAINSTFSTLTTAEIKDIQVLFGEDEGLLSNIYKIKVNEDADLNITCMEMLYKDPNIEYAEPNYIYRIMETPNDPSFSQLWGIQKIEAPRAWDEEKGSEEVIVCVLDSGVDYNHEDLKDNIWVNTGEIPNNGVDDDGNGYIDDYYGYDFGDNDSNPIPGHFHGTHVAGTIAAVGNNGKGVIGVAPEVKIMAVKISPGSAGRMTVEAIVKGIQYAVKNGARVINMSFGGPGACQTMHNAVREAVNKGVVCVAAAGNDNNDAGNYCPASFEEVICVSATTQNDGKASFSNWGEAVDVGAPGVQILSTMPGNKYGNLQGTSMATPHVCGVAGLVLSVNPSFNVEDVKKIIYESVDDIGPPGKDKNFGYGRINAYKAVLRAKSYNSGLIAHIKSPKTGDAISNELIVIGKATGDNFNDYYLEISKAGGDSWIQLGGVHSQPVNDGVLLDKYDISSFSPGNYILRLVVEDGQGNSIRDTVSFYILDNVEFPYKLSGYLTGGIKIADINNDGKNEMIFLITNDYIEQKDVKRSTLYVMEGDGSIWKGFPVDMEIRGWITPALADIDQDGNLEIVISGHDTTQDPLWSCFLTAIKPNGELAEGFWGSREGNLIHGQLNTGGYPSSPVITDLDDDGQDEILVVALMPGTSEYLSQKLYLFQPDGRLKNIELKSKLAYRLTFPQLQAVTPVVRDLDNDGRKEILLGDLIDEESGEVYLLGIFDSNGNLKYKVKDPEGELAIYSRIAVGNLYGGGKTGIVLIRATENGDRVYVINDRYEIESGWPKKFDQSFYLYEPVLMDIDGDNNLEVFVKAKDKIYAWHHDGTVISGWPIMDNSGSLKSICFGSSGTYEKIIGDKIYDRDGSPLETLIAGDINSILVMDHVIGDLDSGSPGPEIAWIAVAEGGYEYLGITRASKVNERSISNWPMLKLSLSNNVARETEGETPPSPPPGPEPNNPPQFINFSSVTCYGRAIHAIKLDEHADDPDGDPLEFEVKNIDRLQRGDMDAWYEPETHTFYWDTTASSVNFGMYTGPDFKVVDPQGASDEITPTFILLQ